MGDRSCVYTVKPLSFLELLPEVQLFETIMSTISSESAQ